MLADYHSRARWWWGSLRGCVAAWLRGCVAACDKNELFKSSLCYQHNMILYFYYSCSYNLQSVGGDNGGCY
jgi:hypothetical protein